MRNRDVLEKLNGVVELYEALVWYARADKTDPAHPGRSEIERVRENNPEEVAALCGEAGDWHHGFNSGCLAIARLVTGWLGTKAESSAAEREFPDLGT